MLKFKGRAILLVLVGVLMMSVNSNRLKAGSTIDLQCPYQSILEIANMRAYVIQLVNAPKNALLEIQTSSSDTKSEPCYLSQDQKLCLFDNFAMQVNISCSYQGLTNIQILSPVETATDEPIVSQIIQPFLPPPSRCVIQFTALSIYQYRPKIIKEMFTDSGCVKSIEEWSGRIFLFAQRNLNDSECIILVNQGIIGEWKMHRGVNYIVQGKVIYDCFWQNTFDSLNPLPLNDEKNTEGLFLSNYYRISPSLNVSHFSFVFLSIQDPTLKFSLTLQSHGGSLARQQFNFTIQSKQIARYKNQIGQNCLKITIAVQGHVIRQVSAASNNVGFYRIEWKTTQLQIVNQNQYLIYYYQRADSISIKGNIIMPVHYHRNISNILVHFSDLKSLSINSERASPLNSPYSFMLSHAENSSSEIIDILLEPLQLFKYFTLVLLRPQITLEMTIPSEIEFSLFLEQIQRIVVSKEICQRVENDMLKVECDGCHFYATFNADCNQIQCCQLNNRGRIANLRRQLKIFAVLKRERQRFVKLSISQDVGQSKLSAGRIVNGIIQDYEQFTYEGTKGIIQIDCHSPLKNHLLILVNVNSSQFPSRKRFHYASPICVVEFSLAGNSLIRITLQNLLPSPSLQLQYSLVVAQENTPIRIDWNTPVRFVYKSRKNRLFEVKTMRSTGRIGFRKYSMGSMSMGKDQLKIQIKSPSPNETKPISLTGVQGFSDITNEIEEYCRMEICHFYLNVNNTGLQSVDTTLVLFMSDSVFPLRVGHGLPIPFFSTSPLHLQCQINPSSPTHLYAYSSDTQLQMKSTLARIQDVGDADADRYMYPQGPQSNWVSYYQYQYIPAMKDYNNQTYALLISIFRQPDRDQMLSNHTINVICTQSVTYLQHKSRLQYRLNAFEVHTFYYDLKGMEGDGADGESSLLLYTDRLFGQFNIEVWIISNLFQPIRMISNHTQLILQILSSQVKQQIEAEAESKLIKENMQRNKYFKERETETNPNPQTNPNGTVASKKFELRIDVRCTQRKCLLLTGAERSNAEYRELVAGVPSGFRIEKYSMVIFVYDNSQYNADFKIKINRKSGFPNYQICSSKKDAPLGDCIKSLKGDLDFNQIQEQDQQNYVSGRSHQLSISQTSNEYCTKCIYFIALSSKYEIVDGSLFIVLPNKAVMLREGNTVTTIVNSAQSDLYSVRGLHLYAVIYQLEGLVQVWVLDKSGKSLQTLHDLTMKSITVNPKEEEQFYIRVRPVSPPASLYSIVLISSVDTMVQLQDGVSLPMHLASAQLIKYRYRPEGIASFQLHCRQMADKIIFDSKCISGGYSSSYDSTSSSTPSSNSGSTPGSTPIPQNTNEIAGIIEIKMDIGRCTQYEFRVSNLGPVQYDVTILEKDTVALQLGKEIHGMLQYPYKIFQIYEIVIREKTELRLVMRFCQCQAGRVMIHSAKSKLFTEQYETILLLSQQTVKEQFIYLAKPGVLFVKIQLIGIGGIIQHTIQVQNMQKTKPRVEFNGGDISYTILNVTEDKTLFQIQFTPIRAEGYQVEYFALEGSNVNLLKKAVNCNGAYFTDIVRHHQSLRQFKIRLNQSSAESSTGTSPGTSPTTTPTHKFNYTTSNPYNYLTIIPVFLPRIEQVPVFSPIRLQNGNKYQLISTQLRQFLAYLQKYLNLHEYEGMVIKLFVIGIGIILGLILIVGVWLGARCCSRTQIVYIRTLRGEEGEEPETTYNMQDMIQQDDRDREIQRDRGRQSDGEIERQSERDREREVQEDSNQSNTQIHQSEIVSQ